MAEIVGGLFGVSPEQLMRQRQTTDTSNAFRFAQLDPMQRAQMSIYQGGAGLGRAVGGLLGGDPELEKISQIKQLSSQFDLTTPQGARDFARALQPFAPAEAVQAIGMADKMEAGGLTRTKTAEETRLLGREIKEIGVDPKNPEMVIKAAVDKDGNIIGYIGQPYSRFTQKSTTTNTTNLPAGESEFVKQLGKNDAGVVTEVMKTRANAISTLQSLEKLEALNNQELIGGTFAEGRVGAANFLSTIGLASPSDISRISSSQQYAKVAKDVIFQTLGGKLGVGFSNEDRKFIEALIPQLETSADARRQLISYMRSKNQLIINESTRLETYARDKRGLGGFEYKIPRETLAPAGSGKAKPEFTLEQLKDRQNQLESK